MLAAALNFSLGSAPAFADGMPQAKKNAGLTLNAPERKLLSPEELAAYDKEMKDAGSDAAKRTDITKNYMATIEKNNAAARAKFLTDPNKAPSGFDNNTITANTANTANTAGSPPAGNPQTSEQRAALLQAEELKRRATAGTGGHVDPPRQQPPPPPDAGSKLVAPRTADPEEKKKEGWGDEIAAGKMAIVTGVIGTILTGGVGGALFFAAGGGLGYLMSKEIKSQ